jgi:protein gp37
MLMALARIEWYDEAINPAGCLRGCQFCYARIMARRLAGMERKHSRGTEYPIEGDLFRSTFHPNKIQEILRLENKRIFQVCLTRWTEHLAYGFNVVRPVGGD